jgi:O-antigen ligase
VALLTVSTAHRFGQLQAEFHRLLDHPDSHTHIVRRSLVTRARLYRDALSSLYASVGLFALGSLLGGVVNLWRPQSLWVVGGLTIVGIAAIVFAAVQLLRESLLSLQVVREQSAAVQESLEDRPE